VIADEILNALLMELKTAFSCIEEKNDEEE